MVFQAAKRPIQGARKSAIRVLLAAPQKPGFFAGAQLSGAGRFRTRKWRRAEDLLKGLGSRFRILSR
jgi:hypothetical protein